jgi:penicillin-binding protein 1A
MEALLVKIFATALALSQVMTTPSAIKTEFDRRSDQPRVAKILNAGCAHMLKAFEVEDINIDDLVATAMDDPQAIEGAKYCVASILPTCRGATSSSARTRRSIAPPSI